MGLTTVGALLVAVGLGASPIVPVAGGNAMTLPSQRHLVRIPGESGGADTLLAAIQSGGRNGVGLRLYRSDDGGGSWQVEGLIQDDASHTDRADLQVVGRDVALVYGWENPGVYGSTRHDIWFQWWRYDAASDGWEPQTPVRVFDETRSDSGFARPKLAIDGQGRLWVQSFRNRADGTSELHVAVSANGGASFSLQGIRATTPARGGGILFATGGGVLMLFDGHDAGTPARWMWRADAWPLSQWSAAQNAFGDGIYHGAALSVVDDGEGGAHVVYKNEGDVLRYSYFDGSGFGAAVTIPAAQDWALQPALTRLESGEVVLFYNQMLIPNTRYEIRARVLEGGVWSAPEVVEPAAGFKGYPSALESLPASTEVVPVIWGAAPDASSFGEVQWVELPWVPTGEPPTDGGVPDGGSDGGTPDGGGGVPDGGSDGGTPDGGEPPHEDVLGFSDSFTRAEAYSLGAGWTQAQGLWRIWNHSAVSDLDGSNQAFPSGVTCADCRVIARFAGFGVPEVAVFARATPSDRYDLALLSDRRVVVRRHRAGTTVVLAQASSGLGDLSQAAELTLEVTGTSPVTLVGKVNGVAKVVATDGSALALTAPGSGGLWTTRAGVWFDDFQLWILGTGAEPDPDPDPEPTPDALLFTDGFSGTSLSSLGAGWTRVSGLWVRKNGLGISDLDGDDQAFPTGHTCADCRVSFRFAGFGVPEVAAFARANPASPRDRYDVALLSDRRVVLRRHLGGSTQILGQAQSGLTDLSQGSTLTLEVTGSGPVTLVAKVNGAIKLVATDSSVSALKQGVAGLWTTRAGVWFDDFELWRLGTTSASATVEFAPVQALGAAFPLPPRALPTRPRRRPSSGSVRRRRARGARDA